MRIIFPLRTALSAIGARLSPFGIRSALSSAKTGRLSLIISLTALSVSAVIIAGAASRGGEDAADAPITAATPVIIKDASTPSAVPTPSDMSDTEAAQTTTDNQSLDVYNPIIENKVILDEDLLIEDIKIPGIHTYLFGNYAESEVSPPMADPNQTVPAVQPDEVTSAPEITTKTPEVTTTATETTTSKPVTTATTKVTTAKPVAEEKTITTQTADKPAPNVSDREKAAALVEVAKSQIGVKEKKSNNVKYNTWFYGHEVNDAGGPAKYAWCAVFVSWCADRAGISEKDIPRYAGVSTLKDYFKKHGIYHSRSGYTPVPGDIIFFSSSHVGIVVSVEDGVVTTVEGNTSDMVKSRTYNLSSSKISGYGSPNYS